MILLKTLFYDKYFTLSHSHFQTIYPIYEIQS